MKKLRLSGKPVKQNKILSDFEPSRLLSNNAAKMSKIWDTGFNQTSFSHTH